MILTVHEHVVPYTAISIHVGIVRLAQTAIALIILTFRIVEVHVAEIVTPVTFRQEENAFLAITIVKVTLLVIILRLTNAITQFVHVAFARLFALTILLLDRLMFETTKKK